MNLPFGRTQEEWLDSTHPSLLYNYTHTHTPSHRYVHIQYIHMGKKVRVKFRLETAPTLSTVYVWYMVVSTCMYNTSWTITVYTFNSWTCFNTLVLLPSLLLLRLFTIFTMEDFYTWEFISSYFFVHFNLYAVIRWIYHSAYYKKQITFQRLIFLNFQR